MREGRVHQLLTHVGTHTCTHAHMHTYAPRPGPAAVELLRCQSGSLTVHPLLYMHADPAANKMETVSFQDCMPGPKQSGNEAYRQYIRLSFT